MKALLKNVKGLDKEVLVYNIQPYEVPTIRYLLENSNVKLGTKIHMSKWCDSSDYVITQMGAKVEVKPIGL